MKDNGKLLAHELADAYGLAPFDSFEDTSTHQLLLEEVRSLSEGKFDDEDAEFIDKKRGQVEGGRSRMQGHYKQHAALKDALCAWGKGDVADHLKQSASGGKDA